MTLSGSTGQTDLRCNFEIESERDVVLACELRAREGEVEFAPGLKLEVLRK